MIRSCKYLLSPTEAQKRRLTAMLRAHCDLYNAALEERRGRYQHDRVSVGLYDQTRQLPWIRANVPGQGQWSAWSQQQTLRRLDQAFQAFFRRVKRHETPGYPRFRSRSRFNAIEMLPGNGSAWKPDQRRVYVHGVGNIRTVVHRSARGPVKTIRITREGRRWYAVLNCEVERELLPKAGKEAGVDVGLTHFFTLDDGSHVANPRYFDSAAASLAATQRQYAASGFRSKKRRRLIGDIHRKIARQRADFHHKQARRLVQEYDVLHVENLIVASMVRSASGTVEHPGTAVAQKTGLNRCILDAGWATFVHILEGKAEEAGRTVVRVDPKYSSLVHHRCGLRGERKGERFWCPHCQEAEHADQNAAINILQRGRALLEAAEV